MALSRPRPLFAHRRTVRLVMEDSMELDSLNIAKSLPDFAKHIRGIVPQFGGKCFDITLESAEKAAELANAGFDYGDVRKPLRLLGKRSIHVSVFVSVEFPDEELVKLLSTYGELKSANLRRLHYPEAGYTHIENGIRVAEFTAIERDIPKRLVVGGVEIGFKYTGQPSTCYRCHSTEHVVRNCPKRRRPPLAPQPTPPPASEFDPDPAAEADMDNNAATSDWAANSEELFSPSTYAEAAANQNSSMDLTPSPPASGRKREAPQVSSDKESVPAKHFASTSDHESQCEESEPDATATSTETPSDSSPPQPPPNRGLKHFLEALHQPGLHRTTFTKNAPGPFFYKCQGHYCYHQYGDFSKQKSRQLKLSSTTQDIWAKLNGTVRQDAFRYAIRIFQGGANRLQTFP